MSARQDRSEEGNAQKFMEAFGPLPASTQIIFLVGPPVCGKSTRADIVCKAVKEVSRCAMIDIGQHIRDQIALGTELGKLLAEHRKNQDAGNLQPNHLIPDLIKDEVLKLIRPRRPIYRLLVVGLPRDIEQAGWIMNMHAKQRFVTVIHITTDERRIRALVAERIAQARARGEEPRADDLALDRRMAVYNSSTVEGIEALRQGCEEVFTQIDSTTPRNDVARIIRCMQLDAVRWTNVADNLADQHHPAGSEILRIEEMDRSQRTFAMAAA